MNVEAKSLKCFTLNFSLLANFSNVFKQIISIHRDEQEETRAVKWGSGSSERPLVRHRSCLSRSSWGVALLSCLSRWRPALDGWSSALRRPVDSGEKFTSLVTVGFIFPQRSREGGRLGTPREARDAGHLGFLLTVHEGGVRYREAFRGSDRENGADRLSFCNQTSFCSAFTIKRFFFC